MESSRKPLKNARKKLETPMEATVPCKLRTTKRPNKSRETVDETKGSNNIQKTKHACIVAASVAVDQSKEQKGGHSGSTQKRKEPSILLL